VYKEDKTSDLLELLKQPLGLSLLNNMRELTKEEGFTSHTRQ